MRILFITPSYKPAFIYGGPIMSIGELGENLKRYSFKEVIEIEVYTTTANGKEELEATTIEFKNVNGVPVKFFKRITKDHSHFSPSLLWNLWNNRKNYDIIHIHSWWNLVSILALFILYFTKIKIVISPRGMLSPFTLRSGFKRVFLFLVGRKLLKRTFLHATSEMEYRECTKLIKNWKGFVAYNYVKMPDSTLVIRQKSHKDPLNSKQPGADLNLIYLSRLDPKKGIELLFDAISKISKRIQIHLQVVGFGEDFYINDLKKLSVELGINDKIEWIGRIDGEDKFSYLAKADLFILPSYNENFANVVIESLAVGTPVLISENVGLKDFVIQNKLGYVCTCNSGDIAQKIEEFFHDNEIAATVKEKSRIIVNQYFNGSELTGNYIKNYKLIIESAC